MRNIGLCQSRACIMWKSSSVNLKVSVALEHGEACRPGAGRSTALLLLMRPVEEAVQHEPSEQATQNNMVC